MGIVETCHTHKFYRHLFFWIIYFFPFETSATASCGYMLYVQYVTIVLKEGCHKASWNFGNSCHCADRWKLQVADVSAFVVPNEAFIRPITLNLLELDAVSCSLHLLKASTCIHQQNDTAMFSLAKVQVHIQCEYPTYKRTGFSRSPALPFPNFPIRRLWRLRSSRTAMPSSAMTTWGRKAKHGKMLGGWLPMTFWRKLEAGW